MSSDTLGYAGMPLELSLIESFRTCESCVYDLAILHAKPLMFVLMFLSLPSNVSKGLGNSHHHRGFFWLPHQHSTNLLGMFNSP